MQLNNFVTRTITGIVFVGLIAGSVFIGRLAFGIVFLFITAFSIIELHKLLNGKIAGIQNIISTASAIILFVLSYLHANLLITIKYFAVFVLLVSILFIVELFRKEDKPFQNVAIALSGIFYIALPFSLLNYFFGFFDTYHVLLAFFIIIWCYDSLAYVVGIKFGKHRLFERISPKKSWEGAIGGAILTLGISAFFTKLFPEMSAFRWIIFSLIIIITGTLGDLSESMIKRSVNAKDSGTLLPGHGGLLDRFDAVLLSSPFIFIYLLFIS